MATPEAEEVFNIDVAWESDINEHLPTIRELASRCSRVTEFGCWRGLSAFASLMGLHDSRGSSKVLTIVDIDNEYLSDVEKKLSPHLFDIRVKFWNASTLDIQIPETDFLFIDSLHTYTQLLQELNMHASKVTTYIAMHDTVSYGDFGEDNETPGLIGAIEEFMETEEGKNWDVSIHYTNNNGMMVLTRKEPESE